MREWVGRQNDRGQQDEDDEHRTSDADEPFHWISSHFFGGLRARPTSARAISYRRTNRAPGSRHGQSHLPLSHGPAGMNERSDSAGVDLSADAGASIEKRLLCSFGLRAVATEGCDRRLWRYRVEPVNRDHT